MQASRRQDPERRRPVVRLWHVGARLAAVLGIGCVVSRWGLMLAITSALSIATVVLTLTLLFGTTNFRVALRITMPITLAVLTAWGLVGVLGGAGASLLALLALTALIWRTWPLGAAAPQRSTSRLSSAVKRSLPDRTPVASVPEPVAPRLPDDDALVGLDDAELCQAWRRSFVALQRSGSVDRRLRVVRFRQLCLDELDRRHPRELRAWLASGARAAGNPFRYLTR